METECVSRERQVYKVTLIGSVVNFLLLIFKFVAGFLGNSGAMLADAVHSLSDFVTDVIVIFFVRISNKPEDKGHDYGHGKYETLATAIIGILLLGVGVGICVDGCKAVYGCWKGEMLGRPGYLALVAALLSVVLKEALYWYTVRCGRQVGSQAVIANAWHHRSDALSSIGTAIGIGGAVWLGESWRVLDPLAAVIVSVFIIKVGVQLLLPCMDELLEKSLPESVEIQIEETVCSCEGVSHVHHLRTRRIGNRYAIEMHVRMDGNLSLFEVHQRATEVENKLREVFGKGTYINIHVEPLKKE